VVLGATACGADHRSAADDRATAIYASVIRAVAPPAGGKPTARLSEPVFVVAANPNSPISLEVQAGIVEKLHRFATIRFVDERSEAIDTADPRRPVHQSGVLITLGDIPPGRTVVTIEGQRYERIGVATNYRIRLRPVSTSWKPFRMSSSSRNPSTMRWEPQTRATWPGPSPPAQPSSRLFGHD
jgi:hypothetical protein